MSVLSSASNKSLSGRDSKSARLRALVASQQLGFLMEAHSGLSAKIVEEAGFAGIWASGLALSAAMGLRDSNEASWTQVLESLEFMADATRVPILVDGDTGYGNFNNVRRLVKKLCDRGIAGVCIEDKLFPKTNSFIGDGQPLADIAEFCGKIKAGKDSQTDPDFVLVARVEALIAGRGMEEALSRAEAYRLAGADAILIHSKSKKPDEILTFAKEWARRAPLVIVPTTYASTPVERFREAGVSAVIWANQTLRASIKAMRTVCERIAREQSLAAVESELVSVNDVFALTDDEELREAERRYLAPQTARARAIVLAASRGEPLGALTLDRPKCMLDLRGEPLLHRLVRILRDGGVDRVTVVRGYRREAIALPSIETVDNDRYAETGEAASLACALDRIEGETLLCYGDVLFRRHILERLMETPGDIALAVDARWRDRVEQAPGRSRDFVRASRAFSGRYLDDDPIELRAISPKLAEAEAHGEWIGLARLGAKGAAMVRAALRDMESDGTLAQADLPALFQRLVGQGARIEVAPVSGDWLDVNDAFDLASARNFL